MYATRGQIHRDDKGNAQPKTPGRAVRSMNGVAGRQIHPVAILQRVQQDPGLLTDGDILRLQQGIGNRAVCQLMSGLDMVQRQNGDANIRDVPMMGLLTVNDNVTILRTGGFAGCIGVILIGPGNTRTLAHIYSGHIQNAEDWGKLGQFTAAAGLADTAHIYHAPGYWERGDRDSGDQFLKDFGLIALSNIIFHTTNPDPIYVYPSLQVTQ